MSLTTACSSLPPSHPSVYTDSSPPRREPRSPGYNALPCDAPEWRAWRAEIHQVIEFLVSEPPPTTATSNTALRTNKRDNEKKDASAADGPGSLANRNLMDEKNTALEKKEKSGNDRDLESERKRSGSKELVRRGSKSIRAYFQRSGRGASTDPIPRQSKKRFTRIVMDKEYLRGMERQGEGGEMYKVNCPASMPDRLPGASTKETVRRIDTPHGDLKYSSEQPSEELKRDVPSSTHHGPRTVSSPTSTIVQQSSTVPQRRKTQYFKEELDGDIDETTMQGAEALQYTNGNGMLPQVESGAFRPFSFLGMSKVDLSKDVRRSKSPVKSAKKGSLSRSPSKQGSPAKSPSKRRNRSSLSISPPNPVRWAGDGRATLPAQAALSLLPQPAPPLPPPSPLTLHPPSPKASSVRLITPEWSHRSFKLVSQTNGPSAEIGDGDERPNEEKDDVQVGDTEKEKGRFGSETSLASVLRFPLPPAPLPVTKNDWFAGEEHQEPTSSIMSRASAGRKEISHSSSGVNPTSNENHSPNTWMRTASRPSTAATSSATSPAKGADTVPMRGKPGIGSKEPTCIPTTTAHTRLAHRTESTRRVKMRDCEALKIHKMTGSAKDIAKGSRIPCKAMPPSCVPNRDGRIQEHEARETRRNQISEVVTLAEHLPSSSSSLSTSPLHLQPLGSKRSVRTVYRSRAVQCQPAIEQWDKETQTETETDLSGSAKEMQRLEVRIEAQLELFDRRTAALEEMMSGFLVSQSHRRDS